MSGSDTAGLKQIDSSPLISPSWIASMISWAVRPLPGISSTSQPHTDATCCAVLGVGDVAVAGELVALVAVLAAALAVALAGDRATRRSPGLPNLPVARPRLMHDEHVLDALGLVLDPAGVQQHPGRRGAPQLGGLLDAGRGHAGDRRRAHAGV